MTIETDCPKCGKEYRLKDEMAGRRFRCKACQSPVTIPDLDASGDDWEADFLGGLDTAVKSERRSHAAEPLPVSGRKQPASGKKSGRKKTGGATAGLMPVLKMVGGVLGAGVGFAIGFIVVRSLVSGSLGGSAPDWQTFTAPAGTYTAEFPSPPKPKFVAGATPGSKTYFGETGRFGCAVTEEPFPPNVAEIDHKQLLQLVADNLSLFRPGSTVTGQQEMTFGEHAAMEIQISVESKGRTLLNTSRIVVTPDRVFTIEYVDAGTGTAADRDRFFGSFKLLDNLGQPQAATWGGGQVAALRANARPTAAAKTCLAGPREIPGPVVGTIQETRLADRTDNRLELPRS